MIGYNIISTGSKGNAVVINKTIMIDCGVPFRALKDVYKDLRLVLLTHEHGDHFNRATIRKLAKERPTLRFVCREWLIISLIECGLSKSKIDVLKENEGICYGEGKPCIESVTLVHNVPNCGWKIHFANYEKLFYATDTNNLDGIVVKNYDLYMIESNYTESDILERIRQKQESGKYCYEWATLNNHLSKEKADNWLYQNVGQNSEYVYLHQHIDG